MPYQLRNAWDHPERRSEDREDGAAVLAQEVHSCLALSLTEEPPHGRPSDPQRRTVRAARAPRDDSKTKADKLAEVPVAGPGLQVTFRNELGQSWTGAAVTADKLGMRIGENNRRVVCIEKGGQAAKAGV